jgi:hypothetical protein
MGSEESISESLDRSEGSAEYSQLLSQMDVELRDAAAAGAAAAVTPGARARDVIRKGRMSGAAAGATGGYTEVSLDDDDEDYVNDDVLLHGCQAGGAASWLAAVGLGPRASSSSLAAATGRAGGSSGGGYLVVDHDSGPTLAYRAKVLRGMLLWRSPGSSGKALGLGLYIIMLLGSIPRALHYMQVSGVIWGVGWYTQTCLLTLRAAVPTRIRVNGHRHKREAPPAAKAAFKLYQMTTTYTSSQG